MNRWMKTISTIGMLCCFIMGSSAFAQNTSSGWSLLDKIKNTFSVKNKKTLTPEEAYEKAMSPEFREKHSDGSDTKTSAFVQLLDYSARKGYLPAHVKLLKLRWLLVSFNNSASPIFAEGVDYKSLGKEEKQARNQALGALRQECSSMKIKAERENNPLAQYAYGTYCTGAKSEWEVFGNTKIHNKAKPWYNMAVAYYRPRAEKGDADALLMMGRLDSQNRLFWNTKAVRVGRYEAFCQGVNLNPASQEDRNLVIKAVERGNTCALSEASSMIERQTKDKLLNKYLAIYQPFAYNSVDPDITLSYSIDGIQYASLYGEDGNERGMNFDDFLLQCSSAQRKRLDKISEQADKDPVGFVRTYLK